ncbi:COG1470 family protein [Streptomyces sp. CA2R101]|uniref:COG1470 family protein n=1 Tax=Streptomyces sp. CA2R101 TaxID=3120152 RepID=UPI00300A24EC
MPFRTRTAVSGVVLATAAVLLCSTAAAARPAAAPPGWSAAPAPGDGAAPGTADRPYFYLEGAPGTVMSDRLSLSNPTGHAVTVRLRGSTPGAWLALASTEVKLPPQTRASVPFTVTVPRDAAPGERSGSLLATRGRGSGADGRDAVPVHLRVTGRPLSALTVEQVSVRRRGPAALIRYTLVNRGNTVLAPRLAVRADGLFGPVLRRAPRALPTTLRPGQGVDLTETWADPPRLDAVDLRLTATAGGGAHGSATATYTTAPWGAVAGGMLLLVAGVGGPVVVRRRRRAGGAREVPGARGAEGAGTARGTAGEAPPPGGDRAYAAGQLAGTGPGARS